MYPGVPGAAIFCFDGMMMAQMESANDDYEILGLPVGAGPVEVKKAYRKLAKEWHPDHFQERGFEERAQAEEKFRKIADAYRRISDSWNLKENRDGRSQAAPPRPRRRAAPKPAPVPASSGDRRIRALFAAGMLLCVFTAAVISIQPGLFDHFAPDIETLDSAVQAPPSNILPQAPVKAEPAAPPQAPAPAALLSEEVAKPSVPPLLGPEREPGKRYYTIGSSQAEVLRLQGQPTRIHGQTWVYGLSEIHFRQGRVWRYNNFDGSLRIRLETGGQGESRGCVTLGSTPEDVLRTHGTPTRIEKDRWFYGYSEIRFKDGRVDGYDNYFGDLNIRLLPAAAAEGSREAPAFFTVGDTPDEVLRVQGTPTGVQGNLWTYNFASVYFREGKVNYVLNSDGGLRYIEPDSIVAAGPNVSH